MAELADARAQRKKPGLASLSGRAWVCVVDKHSPAHFCCEKGVGTIALCHSNFRRMTGLRVGDVLFMVSGPGPTKLDKDGVKVTHKGARALLNIYVEDGSPSLAPSTYHGLNAPRWVAGRSDVSYMARVEGADPRGHRQALEAT